MRPFVTKSTIALLFPVLTSQQIESLPLRVENGVTLYDPIAALDLLPRPVKKAKAADPASVPVCEEPEEPVIEVITDPDVIAQIPKNGPYTVTGTISYGGKIWHSTQDVARLRGTSVARARVLYKESGVKFIRVAKYSQNKRPLIYYDIETLPPSRKSRKQPKTGEAF
jgi:hypothetical protein